MSSLKVPCVFQGWKRNSWMLPMLVAVVLLGVAVSAFVMSDKERATMGYLRVERAWANHWPLVRGKGVLARFRPLMYKIGTLKSVRAEIEPGVSLLLDPRDWIGSRILVDREWEPRTWQAISNGLPVGAIFLDVGAHIGYFAIKSAVKVGKGGQVVAFEPNPNTLRLLRENVAASNAANVIIQPIACTDREQMLTLYEGPATNIGDSSLSRKNAELESESPPPFFTVRGRAIDDVVRELRLRRVDVVKVDVEGAEYNVVRGARETLKRFQPKLILEMNPQLLSNMQTKVDDLIFLIKEIGYNRSRHLEKYNWEWAVE